MDNQITVPQEGIQPGSKISHKVRRYRNSYQAAQRHTRWVKILKVMIPVGSVTSICGIFLILWLDPFHKIQNVSVDHVNISGTQVTMQAPKLTGFSKGTRPYKITAIKAVQDLSNMNIIFLTKLDAHLTSSSEGDNIHILADNGIYDTQTEHLEMKDNIIITTEDGQKIKMSSAAIDMKAGTVHSKESVEVMFPDGEIRSNEVEVTNNGDVVTFKRDVEAVFYAEADKSTPVPVKPAPVKDEGGEEKPVSSLQNN